MGNWKLAFSLSKEEVQLAMPLGTSRLIDDAPWRKFALLLIASVYAFTANYISSNISPGLTLWPAVYPEEQKTFPELVYLIAVNVLFLGASNIVWVPLSNWMGRRPVLLIATLLMNLSCMWAGLATSYNSLLAARAFQGIGGGAADTVAPALVGDVYFLYERGRAMAMYTVFRCIGPIAGGIAGGYTAFGVGWAYNFWVGTAISALCFVGVALLVPETLYDRQALEEPAIRQTLSKEAQTTHTETIDNLPPARYP